MRKRLRFEAVDGEFSVVAANSENRRYLASYFHRHSEVSRASSRHSGAGTGYVRATDPDTVLPALARATARSPSPGQSASRRTGPRVPVLGRRSARDGHAAASIDGHISQAADRLV